MAEKKSILVLVLTLLLLVTKLMAGTIAIYPSDDSYVDSGAPDDNFGSIDGMYIGGEIKRGYLKFNLSSIPSNQNVISARLHLSPNMVPPSTEIGAHYLASDAWNETTITWNNAPTGFEPAATDTITITIEESVWTVTADVDTAHRDDGAYSVVLKLPVEPGVYDVGFWSSEFFIPQTRPYLEVEYGIKYSGGTGEPNDPYLIATAEDLNDIGNHSNDWDKTFLLTADINLSGYTGTQFNMIGTFYVQPSIPFSGTFDGNDHQILNFNYKTSEGYAIGLFAAVGSNKGQAHIRNLTLVDPNVDAGAGGDVGALIGLCYKNASISNCRIIKGLIKGRGGVGGLIGSISYGNIRQCSSSADIVATTLGTFPAPAGGLIGGNNFGLISQCCSTGSVTSDGDGVGGLIGHNASNVTNCYSSANVEGKEYVGGMLGYNGGDVNNCYSVGSVSGTGDYVGGFIGASMQVVTACFWDIETSGQLGPWIGTGLTTEEMQTESTFTDAGWDFVGETVNGTEDIWDICDGTNYPKLAWQIPLLGDFLCPDGVNFIDYSFFGGHWLDVNCPDVNDCNGCDLDFSDTVDANDLKIFCDHWLEGL